ncbi:MAG TPA: 5'-nucleotidase C-terminal domain-containing protein, partial [bacterium]|nr:5'-nucleotidase C-terminal domain-containing protein [bacterium]
NGGGINGPISNINPTSFRNGDALDFFKSKFFRFDNYLAVVELTPLEIKNLLEYGVAQMWYQNGENTLSGNAGVSDGNFLHCSGLNFTYTRGASAADNNAYFYNATDKQIKNYGSRIIDVWLWNIPQYDEINDKYDTGLYQKLHNPSADSIQIIKNGEVVAAYKDMKIGVVTVNFLLYGDESCKTALGLSGPNDSKIKLVDSANRPNEALVSILADGNYYLYHRLQGRTVVKETGVGSQSNVSGSVLLAIGSTQLSNYIVAGSNPKTDTSLTSTLTFTLVDPDLNRFSYQQEIYDTTWNILRIYNASRQPSTEIELIALTEGGQNSKGFIGTVKTSNDVDSTFAANNGVLIGKDGDEVRIVYQDPFNSTDRLELRKTLIEGTLASNNFREDVKSITLSNVTSSGDVDTGNITTFSWSSSGFFTL